MVKWKDLTLVDEPLVVSLTDSLVMINPGYEQVNPMVTGYHGTVLEFTVCHYGLRHYSLADGSLTNRRTT